MLPKKCSKTILKLLKLKSIFIFKILLSYKTLPPETFTYTSCCLHNSL